MKLSISTAAVCAGVFLATSNVNAFSVSSSPALARSMTATTSTAIFSTMADSGSPPKSSDASTVSDAEIPTNLPSEKGMDYVPLATMLATGQLAEADQVCIYVYMSYQLFRFFHQWRVIISMNDDNYKSLVYTSVSSFFSFLQINSLFFQLSIVCVCVYI